MLILKRVAVGADTGVGVPGTSSVMFGKSVKGTRWPRKREREQRGQKRLNDTRDAQI